MKRDDSRTGKPEVLTLEAIERDPLAAVYAPLPDQPDFELLNAAFGAATVYWSEDTALGRKAAARVDELFAADAKLLQETGEDRAPLGANPELWAQAQQREKERALPQAAELREQPAQKLELLLEQKAE